MRRFLLFITTLLLIITLLHSPTVRTQEPEKPLPNPADYPPAGENCKNKVRVSPWVGTPDGGCILDIHTCKGVETTSVARPARTGYCDDFWAVHAALGAREICCDSKPSPDTRPRTPEEKKKKEGKKYDCEEPKDHGPPWIDPAADCRDLKKAYAFIEQNPIYLPRGGRVTCKLFAEICGERILIEARDLVAPDPRQPGNAPLSRGGFCYDKLYRFSIADRSVCCDQWRNAVQTATPCDPRSDLDCDGLANAQDRFALDPRPTGFALKTTLPNLPFDWNPMELLPDELCPNCLWELVGMTVTHVSLPGPECLYTYRGHWLCRSRTWLVESEKKAKTVPGPCRS